MESNHHAGGGPLLREVAARRWQNRVLSDAGAARASTAMVCNRPDWCVSRQRNWGVPMAFFVAQGERRAAPAHRRADRAGGAARRAAGHRGLVRVCAAEELLGARGRGDYRKVPDTLDVWFESGTTHVSVLERRAELTKPADLYLEGSDQHRGWFQSSLLTGCARSTDARPYRQILTHGFVVDETGPQDEQVARQRASRRRRCRTRWVPRSCACGWPRPTTPASCRISQEILKRVVEMYRRIRNTLRFLLANVSDFDPEAHGCRWSNGSRSTATPWLMAAETAGREVMRDYDALRVPLRRAEAAQLLLRVPGRVLPRHPQGPALHDAAPRARRAAPPRARSTTSPTACCGCSRRC